MPDPTMPDTATPSAESPVRAVDARVVHACVVIALLGAACASGSLVARSSVAPSWLTETLAATCIGQLTLLACVGWLWASGRSQTAVGVVCGTAVIAVVWATVLLQGGLDPTGLGLIGASGTPVAVSAAVSVLAVLGGFLARRTAGAARLGGSLPRSAVWGVAAVVTGAALLLGRLDPWVAAAASVLAATAIMIAGETSSDRERDVRGHPSTATLFMVGAAVGVVGTAPATLAFIGDHSPDRLSIVAGSMQLAGPIFVIWTWVALLGACVGVVGAAMLATIRQRSLRAVSNAGALVVIGALTMLSRTATTINLVNDRRDGGDQFFYHVTANLLAQGRGFLNPVAWAQDGQAIPSALHGPAFPIVLSLWSRLGGTTYFDHQLVSVLLGIPQVVFGVMLAHHVAGRRAAIVAAVLLLAYPNIWVTDGSMWVEGMMAGITTAATWLMYRWHTSPRIGIVAWAGALIGAAALTRGEAVLMTVLLVLPLVATSELTRKKQFRHLAVCATAFIAVIAPWTIYNATRFDLLVPLSTNSNEVIYYANCPDSYYGPRIGFWSFACQERYRAEFGDPPGDESVRNQAYRDIGLEYARDNASQVPKVIVARVGRQWELFRPLQNADFGFVEGRPRDILRAGLGMYYVMMALAVAGTVALRRRKVPVWPLWSHAVMVTFTAVYAYGNLRFRAPFEPILCVMAAVGIVALFDRYRPQVLESDVPET
ncbi:MAG TPA: glycosyltransferase family 39 protein [Ilumatobacter sp.]|nr:glycosyltransferase family 39 protein [Ilumatobacter sp.]